MSYGPDLAFIHDAGFTGFAEASAPGVLEILWRRGIRDGLVVDAGCGSGVLSRELLRAGFEVFAFDPSPAMIELARDVAPQLASLETVALPRCNAIVAVGEIVNYASDVSSFFTRAFEALAPGGVLLFDAALFDETAHLVDRRVDGEDWVVFSSKSLDDRTLVRRITTYRLIDGASRKSEEVHRLRLYGRSELTAMLRDAGFSVKVRRSYGGPRLPPAHAVFLGVRRQSRRPRALALPAHS